LRRYERSSGSAEWNEVGQPVRVRFGRAGLGLGKGLHAAGAAASGVTLDESAPPGSLPAKREGERRAEKFQAALEARGIPVAAMHVATGVPEKALVNLAAENRVGLVVLGIVGRRKLAGRVVGNTAEQILRLLKADVLALKP